MPTPIIGELKFNIWYSEYVFGLPGQTEASVYVAQVDDVIINSALGTIDKVVSVDVNHIPTLAPFKNASGFDGEVLDNHPSRYEFRNRRLVPDLNIWYSNTGGGTPKPKLVAQPDPRVLVQCKDAANYRIFLGTDCSDTTGTCISGDPSVSDIYDVGLLTFQSGTYQVNSGKVNLSMHLRQGEVVSVVFYDNTNNIISIRPMRANIRGAVQNTYSATINGYAVLSKFNSTTDYNFLDCRFVSTISPEDFGFRKFLSDGTYVDLPYNTTECTLVGLDAFLAGDSYYKTELVLLDKVTGFNMVYRVEKGGSSIVDVPTGIDPFDWTINQYDLVNGSTVYNGNERPQSVSADIVIYPKGGWEVGARPTTLTILGVYTGGNDGGTLGSVTIFDKAGNKISYNNIRTYNPGDNLTPNQFKSIVSLYYVGDVDIGGALISCSNTTVAVNTISRTGTFNKDVAQFGLQAVGSTLSYTFDAPNNTTVFPLDLGTKHTLNNELPYSENNAFTTVGGYPWCYGYYTKPNVSNIRYGEYLIPYYGSTGLDYQGMEFLGRDIDFNANQFIIEAVFCLREDYTFDPTLAEPILAGSSNPQLRQLADNEVVVPVRPYVPGGAAPVNPVPSLIPVYVMDPMTNTLFDLPYDPDDLADYATNHPDFDLGSYHPKGMVFPNVAYPNEVPEDNIYVIAGVPPSQGGYLIDAIADIPIIADYKGAPIHYALHGNDYLYLDTKNIEPSQPFFFSFWRLDGSTDFVFTTGRSIVNLYRSPKVVIDNNVNSTTYYGVHCAITTEYDEDNDEPIKKIGIGSGTSSGYPSYTNEAVVPFPTDGLDHIVVYNNRTEISVYCNKVLLQSYPIPTDPLGDEHNLFILGNYESLNLSHQIADIVTCGITGIEVYYGDPTQEFVDYLFDKSPEFGFVERLYVDDVFNVTNKNTNTPYLIEPQNVRVVDHNDIIYKSSLMIHTRYYRNAVIGSSPPAVPVGSYAAIGYDGSIIPWRVGRVYSPRFDLGSNIGTDDYFTITYTIDVTLTFATFFLNEVEAKAQDIGGYRDPVLFDCLGTGRTYTVVAFNNSTSALEVKEYRGVLNGSSLLVPELVTTIASIPMTQTGKKLNSVTMVYNKSANTLTININRTGAQASDNISFAGYTVTIPFIGSKYRYFMPCDLLGYSRPGTVFDLEISRGRIPLAKYNDNVLYTYNNPTRYFRYNVIGYDLSKSRLLTNMDSMYAVKKAGALGGAVLYYRNDKPLSNLEGMLVTTKTNPFVSPGSVALDKLDLTSGYDTVEIEWRINIRSLRDTVTEVTEEHVVLLEKHSTSAYTDGYTLVWDNGRYYLNFNKPSGDSGTGLSLSAVTAIALDTWHIAKYVISGNTVSFHLNGTLVESITLPTIDAKRLASDGLMRIGFSVEDSDSNNLTTGSGTTGLGSTDFDLDYLIIRQNSTEVFNLHFGIQNVYSDGGGSSELPYFTMKVGDNELKIDTVNKRAVWINTVEGLLVEPTTDLVSILNRNLESINIITLVRKGSKAAMFINGARVWYNDVVDYDEDVGAQEVKVNWGITTQYGPVPYLQSLIVYSGSSWIDAALAPSGSPTVPISELITNSDYVRIDNTTINGTSKAVFNNVVNFSNTVGLPSIVGDVLKSTYPWV